MGKGGSKSDKTDIKTRKMEPQLSKWALSPSNYVSFMVHTAQLDGNVSSSRYCIVFTIHVFMYSERV